jgi:hypothetical protein
MGLIHTFRIFYCVNAAQIFYSYFHLEEKYMARYTVCRLVFLIFSVAHYNCLLFYYISQSQGHDEITWIEKFGLSGATWIQIYEQGLYFIIITMITVGFGDITPVTSRERVYVIIMTLFSCFLFGYAVNTVGSIFQQRDQELSIFK